MLTTSPPYRLQHLGDGPLGQPEETGEVDADHQGVILGGVVGKRLRVVDAGVVDQGVDAAEPLQCSADDPVGGAGSAMSPSTVSTSGSSVGLIVRAVAATLQLCRR
jgi:hypothetical protein